MIRRTLLLTLCAALLLTGCAGQRVNSDSPGPTREAAIALALQRSPLREVTDTALTPPGPVMWVVYGRDEQAKPLAVWVRRLDQIEGYAYMDHGVRQDAALTAAEQRGLQTLHMQPVLVRPAQPAWYVFVQWPAGSGGQSYVLVDLATAEMSGPPLAPAAS